MYKLNYFILCALLFTGCGKKFGINKCYIHEKDGGLFLNHVIMYKIREFSFPDLEYRVAIWNKTGWHTIGVMPLNEHYIEVRCPKNAKEQVVWMVVAEEDLCYYGFPEKCR